MSYNKTITHSQEGNGYDDKTDVTAVITECEGIEEIYKLLKQYNNMCRIYYIVGIIS